MSQDFPVPAETAKAPKGSVARLIQVAKSQVGYIEGPKDKEPEITEEEDKNEIDDVFLIEDHLINNDSEPQVTEEPQPVEEPQIVEEGLR